MIYFLKMQLSFVESFDDFAMSDYDDSTKLTEKHIVLCPTCTEILQYYII